MTYRFPIVVGDRVAIAPHHDLWVAGCRFGTVTSINANTCGGRFYFVDLDTGRNVTLSESDLLGAVGPVGGSAVQQALLGGATRIAPVETVTYRVAVIGSTPNGEDVTIPWYTGPSHTAALAALVQAGACPDDSEGVPHAVRFINKSVTLTFVRES